MSYARRITAIVGSLMLLASCEKKTAEAPPPPTPVPATPIPPTPAPVVVATPPPATPELAPPGVFYLIEAAHVETTDGIVGLKPGTGVKLVRPGIYLTPAGEVPLREEQLTNDMGLARRIMLADREGQAALKAALSAQAQQVAAEEKAMAEVAAPPMQPGLGPRTARLNQIRLQITALEGQIGDLQAQEAHRHYIPRAVNTSDVPARIEALRNQIRQLEQERRTINATPQ